MYKQEPDVRPIDAIAFSKQIAAATIALNLDAERTNALIDLVKGQPTMSLVPQTGHLADMKEDMPDIHKCKFCGGPASLYVEDGHCFPDEHPPVSGHYISCMACGCRTPMFRYIGNAIRAWNREPEET